jgi:prevent-host-death family protein
MTRTISSNQAKQRWGAVISSVSEQGDEVIVESHGKPKVAVISYEEFERFNELRKKQQREELMERLRVLEAKQLARNNELTDEQVEVLADRAAHEAFDDLAEERKLTFKRDRHSQ